MTPTRCTLALALVASILPSLVHAQAPRDRISDQLALARLCASEVGFPERLSDGRWQFYDDCAAIYQAIQTGADNTDMRWQSFARAYSGRVFDQTLTHARSWVAHLRVDGREPHNWPTQRFIPQRDGTVRVERHAPWNAFREAWLALYEHAGRIIAGEVIAPCESTISDWGGAMDRERAERIGLIPVVCGTTRNDFYIRPSWATDADPE
jgi:hypothetical protein